MTSATLGPLVESYPFKPYRRYRVVSRARQTAVMQAEVEATLATPGHAALMVEHAAARACALVRPLAWDSAFFGVPMARVDAVLRSDDAAAVLGDALTAALERCRADKQWHVTLKVDAEDQVLLSAAQRAGFRHVETLLTYFTHPKGPAPTVVRTVGTVRPFAAGDADAVLDITREAYHGVEGRFHRDPHLPRERADAFYLEWARQCLAGVMAQRIDVSEGADGRLIGWAGVRRIEPFSTVTGLPLFAGSLGACRRDAPGAYAGIIREAALLNHRNGHITETQTPAANVVTANIYEAVGARFVRADHTLHAWVG